MFSQNNNYFENAFSLNTNMINMRKDKDRVKMNKHTKSDQIGQSSTTGEKNIINLEAVK